MMEATKMVVGPLVKRLKLTAEEKNAVNELEKKIDGCIKETFRQGRSYVTVPCDRYSGLGSMIMQKLLDRYKKAGWDSAEVKQDQRDGSWIELRYEN